MMMMMIISDDLDLVLSGYLSLIKHNNASPVWNSIAIRERLETLNKSNVRSTTKESVDEVLNLLR